jgi:rod shape-determining protein MreC
MYRRSGRGRLLLLVFLALSIFIITLDFRQNEGGPLERAKDISVSIVAPIQRGLTTVFRPVGDFFASIGELGGLRSENQRLEARLEAAESQVSSAEALEDDFTKLLRLSNLEEPWTAMDKLTARVFSNVSSNYRWAQVINKGRSDGIRPDMAVVNANGLVGKIVKPVTSHTATVLLLIDPRGAAGARIADRRDTGKIQGYGDNDRLSLELIGSNSDVFQGDMVITSGYNEGIFPPSIPIGIVEEVIGDVRAPDHTIIVEPFVNFNELDYVLVLLESGRSVAQDGGRG